jgi:ABC-type nickel/cobalt efflux system permease component RcnA
MVIWRRTRREMHTHTHTHTHTHAHTHKHTLTHTHTYTHTNTHTHTHTHTHTNKHTRTPTHTRTHTRQHTVRKAGVPFLIDAKRLAIFSTGACCSFVCIIYMCVLGRVLGGMWVWFFFVGGGSNAHARHQLAQTLPPLSLTHTNTTNTIKH